MTRVVHVRKEPYDTYIGRSFMEFGESVWHNPFRVEPGCGRKCVIERYEAHVRSRPDLMARLPELRGRTLGCWCKPRPATETCWRGWRTSCEEIAKIAKSAKKDG